MVISSVEHRQDDDEDWDDRDDEDDMEEVVVEVRPAVVPGARALPGLK